MLLKHFSTIMLNENANSCYCTVTENVTYAVSC